MSITHIGGGSSHERRDTCLNIIYQDDWVQLIQGDCLEVMDELIKQKNKFNAIIADIPQEITQNDWDRAIPLMKMWELLYQLRNNKQTPIILFTNQPFTTDLINSNKKHFKYMKYWQKDRPSGFLNARKMPLKDIEEIAIFYEQQCIYNPIMREGSPSHSIGKAKGEKLCKNNNNYGNFGRVEREGTLKYPRQLMYYPRPHPPIHPTQKPVKLLEDLIITYTNENDLILDFTCGSGTTLLAARNLNRRCIGIELEEKYCEVAKQRLENKNIIIE